MLSIVIPIFNEEPIIERLHRELVDAVCDLDMPWEVVYVNDASNDRSLELLLNLQRNDARVVVVELSRNWGHQSALAAGLSQARGDAVVLMDGDLQDPPQVIPGWSRLGATAPRWWSCSGIVAANVAGDASCFPHFTACWGFCPIIRFH